MKKYIELTSFTMDKNSPVALHLQLAEELLKQLRAASPSENHVLPSERTLVKQFEINRLTVHRAYAYLLENNLVVKNPDKSLSVARTARKQLQGTFPVIGIILPEKFSTYSKRPIAMEYLKGIIDRSTELGVSTMMLTPPLPGASAEITNEFIETHCANTVGIIHLGSRGFENDDVLEKILNYTGVPQVFISGYSNKTHIGSVSADLTQGITELCKTIKAKGAKKIGIISQQHPNSVNYHYCSDNRVEQVKRIFENNGLEISCELCCKSSTDINIDKNRLPDVFWCYNDEYAKTLMSTLKQQNITVPDDVMVAGFDGHDFEFDGRKITTVDQSFLEIGRMAVDLTLEHYRFGVTEQNKDKKIETVFISGDTL